MIEFTNENRIKDQDDIGANFYQTKSLRTIKNPIEHGSKDQSLNALLGLAGETGELCDYFKKGLYQGHDIDPLKVLDECGDILWYVQYLLSIHGFTMAEAMKANILKLEARYPEGFKEKDSVERDMEKENKELNKYLSGVSQ